jgi:ubiquinone/menaquinone biosynthesis C-methylase UbiE
MLQSSKLAGYPNYSVVSEIPGIRVTREAVSMLYTRYAFASRFCEGKDVLELCCGAGMGLGHLARHSRSLVGGDYTEPMLRMAQRVNLPGVALVRLDAQRLPFKEGSFDIVLAFEAIYYLVSPQAFIQECRRVLRGSGTLLICSANKECPGFSPSALTHGYFSAAELRQVLEENGFDAEVFGGFRNTALRPVGKLKEFIRKLAVRSRLIPSTMRGKQFLKRVFYGRLIELGASIAENAADYNPPALISPNMQKASEYKVIYAVGRIGRAIRVAVQTS